MSNLKELYEANATYIENNPGWQPDDDSNTAGTFIGYLVHIDYMMSQIIAVEDCTDFEALTRACDETYPRISDFVRQYQNICQVYIDEYNEDPIPYIVCSDANGIDEKAKLIRAYRHYVDGMSREELLTIGHLNITKDENGLLCVVPYIYGQRDVQWDKCLLADFDSDIEAQMRAIRRGLCNIIFEQEDE